MRFIDLQLIESMDHASADTGQWLAYSGECPVPEVANVFRHNGIELGSFSGRLPGENAWRRIRQWVRATAVRVNQVTKAQVAESVDFAKQVSTSRNRSSRSTTPLKQESLEWGATVSVSLHRCSTLSRITTEGRRAKMYVRLRRGS